MPLTADPCPDPDLLAGGRVPDPLRSRIALHVAHCEVCSAALEALSHPATGTPPLDPRAPAFGGLAAITAARSRFEIVRHLGAGGMGTVYEAFDREHATRIALKVLRHVAPESLLRFKREFRSLQNLHHPNLVRLGELIGCDESWLFTMELVEGVRFLDHVRPAGAIGFDDGRLRDAFGQLVDGLAALHAIGKVHRDVKPSNALVAQNGRVVLLDLGLVLDDHQECDSITGHALGTVAYMAPEQALGQRVGPAADWYAAGVVLYQALTGRLPFCGGAAAVAAQKQHPPVAPRTWVPALDDSWNELCVALLQPDPAARPSAIETLRLLGGTRRSAPSPRRRSQLFVGRERELAELSRGLDEARGGAPVAIFVAGESGIGKSALVQRFTDEARHRGALVLAGRCYERESVPFKAVDGIIDALARHLALVPAAEAAAVLPRHAALLTRAFPVLAGAAPVSEAVPGGDVGDPQELRRRLLVAFRDLFARLAERQPIMLVIDDVHWADADSFALLAELFRQPDAPALLLVATVRSSAYASAAAHVAAARDALGGAVRVLELERLLPDDARALATALVGDRPTDVDAALLAEEANGHPLFIHELVGHGHAGMRLDESLQLRIAQLEPVARGVLQLAALSAGRLARGTAARAARLDAGELERIVDALRSVNLARTSGAAMTDRIEPYHDRVRAAVLAGTAPIEAREIHRALAGALADDGNAEAEALALHWCEAGDPARAATYAAEGARRASRTLAFERAAQLYRFALDLRVAGGDRELALEQELRVALGHALVNAGRGAEAAEVYLVAAEQATGDDALELRRCASEQLVRSGHVERGIATLRSALQPYGIRVATKPGWALCSLLMRRAQVRLRGLGYRERAAADVPARALTRIDFCYALSSSLSYVDPLLGSDLHALHLLLALRAGEPTRVARALAGEAVYAASVGATARAARLQARARALAARADQPYIDGVARLCFGMVSALEGRFAEALEYMHETQRILRAGATGVAWELDVAENFTLELLGWMGQLDELSRRVPAALREAYQRGDVYFATSGTGMPNLIWLQRDDPDRARLETVRALEGWPQRGFDLQQYWHLYAQTQIDLYSGDATGAYRRLAAQWPELEHSMLLRVQYFRIAMIELRARTALGAAAACTGREARDLISRAKRDVRRLRRERVAWADGLAWLLQAGIARLCATERDAIDALTSAVATLTASDLALFAAAARHRLAALSRKPDPELDAWFAESSVVAPGRMVAMLTPAFETTRALTAGNRGA